MDRSTLPGTSLATPFVGRLHELGERLTGCHEDLIRLLEHFLDESVTPAGTYKFERNLHEALREFGRVVLGWALNQLEPEEPSAQMVSGHEWYRLRPKSPRRNLDSLFGPVKLWRFRYEALTAGEPSRFPLEDRLGIEAQRATPALAERTAQWAVGQTQDQVLAFLRRDHGVCWSVETLRNVTQSMSAGMAEHREAAQLAKIQAWLKQAESTGGRHQPVLSVGRDGVMVPVRNEKEYREASAGTLSVIDGRGKRVGTVYLGRMPEERQKTLSKQMTRLITQVVASCSGRLPRLHYVTDGGLEPTRYFLQVLRKLADPRHPRVLLVWTWAIDFYHASSYITKMSEGLYGSLSSIKGWASKQRHSWASKMRRCLRDKRNGVYRVLHSAAALRSRSKRHWTAAENIAFRKGYRYLKKRREFMSYAAYKARGLPIGSGITEAACKTVFTHRLKQSGMTWGIEGGQTIIDLRTIWLSGVWDKVHGDYLAAKSLPGTGTQRSKRSATKQKAA